MSTSEERKAERRKRVAERTELDLREQAHARAAWHKAHAKPTFRRRKPEELDPDKPSMFWVQD